MQISDHPSPNFNARQHDVNLLVLHYTGMENGVAALQRMCDPQASVSAHYMVWEDGRIARLVAEDHRAWHAGVSSWQGDDDLNSRSIGIEVVNGGHDFPSTDGSLPPYPEAQIDAVVELCLSILSRYPIPATRVVAHSDIAPARKIDPGEHFPWHLLAKAGVGLWPDLPAPLPEADVLLPGDTGPPIAMLQAQLQQIGYGLVPAGVFDALTGETVRAFQRRWLPERLTGQADALTQARIAQIAGAFARR